MLAFQPFKSARDSEPSGFAIMAISNRYPTDPKSLSLDIVNVLETLLQTSLVLSLLKISILGYVSNQLGAFSSFLPDNMIISPIYPQCVSNTSRVIVGHCYFMHIVNK